MTITRKRRAEELGDHACLPRESEDAEEERGEEGERERELGKVADEWTRDFQKEGSAKAGIFHHLITLPTYHTHCARLCSRWTCGCPQQRISAPTGSYSQC